MDNSAHLYMPIDDVDDDVAYERNLDLLKSELSKSKPRPECLRELMQCTFPNRWDAVINGLEPVSVRYHIQEFPLLKKASYVSDIQKKMICVT